MGEVLLGMTGKIDKLHLPGEMLYIPCTPLPLVGSCPWLHDKTKYEVARKMQVELLLTDEYFSSR